MEPKEKPELCDILKAERDELLEVLRALLDPCPLPSKYGEIVKDYTQFESEWREKGLSLIKRIEAGNG